MDLSIRDNQWYQIAVLFLINQKFDSWLYRDGLGFFPFVA